MELEPANWKPLERLIGCRCGEFMWMWRENGLEHYKHVDSRQFLDPGLRRALLRPTGRPVNTR